MSLPQNKRFAARRLLCLLLALAFGLALAGCGSSASSEPAAQDQEQVLTDDALYELTAEKVDQPLDGTGAAIALAVGAEGTDIGAGTTFNMLQTLNEAYKVLQLQGYRLSAYEAFYLATLGGAKSLGLDDLIGNFLPGKEADFVVMEPTATPLQQLRYDNSVSLVDKLFVMMTLGDDRSIYRTYVDGRLVYERN